MANTLTNIWRYSTINMGELLDKLEKVQVKILLEPYEVSLETNKLTIGLGSGLILVRRRSGA